MKKLISLFLIIILYSNICLADDCSKPVLYLAKGTPADCNSYRFSLTKESQIRKDEQDYQLLKQEDQLKDDKINALQEELNNSQSIQKDQQNELNLWHTKAVDSTEKLISADNTKHTDEIIMFALGLLTAIGAGIAFHYAAK